jgi:hypothetical protein
LAQWGQIMARKGDLKGFKHVNVLFDEPLSIALEQSAARNERRLTEEVRYAVRQYLKIDQSPAEDTAGVSA